MGFWDSIWAKRGNSRDEPIPLTAEFWQREAHRYDTISRQLMNRVRVEISLGVSALVSIVALIVANSAYEFLVVVPLFAAAVWSLVLWTVQESFLLDAHMMYAERMVSQRRGANESPFPAWADNGGKIGRFGYTLRLMIGAWALVTLLVLFSSVFFIAVNIGLGPFFIIATAECVIVLAVLGFGAWSVDRSGGKLFAQFEDALLSESGNATGRP